MIKKRRHLSRRDPFLDLDSEGEGREYQEPASWTIITALNRVLELAEDSQLSEEFWEKCKKPLAFLRAELGFTDIQIVVLTIMIEAGEPVSWRKLGEYVDCTRLQMMTYTEEIEEMIAKRWIIRRASREMGTLYDGFALVPGVIKALRHNKAFVPEKIDNLSEQQFIDMMVAHVDKNFSDHNTRFSEDEEWMMIMVEANMQLPLCQEVQKLEDIHDKSLLLMVVFDYAQYGGSHDEGLHLNLIDKLYPDDYECDFMRNDLREGNHVLMEEGLIEHKCVNGLVDNEQYVLTTKAKSELFISYTPRIMKAQNPGVNGRFIKSHTTIKEKPLFFNAKVDEQVQRLTSLLSIEHLPTIQQRLEERGMRKGFACLFYGAPGTGKTETVLQMARLTGRDLMQVDIAGMRDKWVGESEKNIKNVFDRYREICQNSDVTPILFFNEADGLINKRTEHIEQSVDKMDNAMQNIILQEIEDLEGILIATTNLTSNLDTAFERRFLFKVEFQKPETEVKVKIWRAMLPELSAEDAHHLATHFDFSGGQIENIIRKRDIDYFLTGRNASLKELVAYCREEQLANKKERKKVAGFGG